MILWVLFFTFLSHAEKCPNPAEGKYSVSAFTNYTPEANDSMNGSCNTSASGKPACNYILEKYLQGQTNAVMGAVTQKQGSTDLFGGVYKAPALSKVAGGKEIIVMVGDRYARSENGICKMDIVTHLKSKFAREINSASGELILVGRIKDLPPPSRKLTLSEEAMKPTPALPKDVKVQEADILPKKKPEPKVERVISKVLNFKQEKVNVPSASEVKSLINNSDQNVRAAIVAQNANIQFTKMKNQNAIGLAKIMSEANATSASNQRGQLTQSRANLEYAVNVYDAEIAEGQRVSKIIASYPQEAMIDFKNSNSEETSTPGFNFSFASIQSTLNNLGQQISQLQANRESAVQMMGVVKQRETQLEQSGSLNNGANMPAYSNSPTIDVKVKDLGSSGISPNSAPKSP